MSAPGSPVVSFLRAVLSGYRRIAAGAGGLLLFFAAIAAAAAAVVLPLWLLSTRLPAVFTALTTGAFGGLLLFMAVTGARRRARLWGGGRRWARYRVLPLLGRIATGLGLVALLYGALLLVATRRYLAGLALLLGLLVLVGLRAHRRRGLVGEVGVPPADDRGDGKAI